ncbi:hypothetical protein DEU56DRAFT_929878 [Suillus clintonianus]|uniref:uncharacterized protein n=1 Tax=Suillus clintonianus TaxID=1904413 RepID=UPI001B86A2BD|nr:uncharacterized protein DEU56DRAFT_929878 [Suillus clintonianus]KAG2118611.1 hypothetical protein DEU56DRAFT_929878 [Suillus clintonianus]
MSWNTANVAQQCLKDSGSRSPVPPNDVYHELVSSTPEIEVQAVPSDLEVEADPQSSRFSVRGNAIGGRGNLRSDIAPGPNLQTGSGLPRTGSNASEPLRTHLRRPAASTIACAQKRIMVLPVISKIAATIGTQCYMFKFNFDVEDDSAQAVIPDAFTELSLANTVRIITAHLPLTFMPGGELSPPRRDLFDVRFQLISQNADDPDASEQPSIFNARSALQFFDALSDLVPLVYEGSFVHGKRVLEIGCGTSIPSFYILHRIFSSLPSQNQTHIHLQDLANKKRMVITRLAHSDTKTGVFFLFNAGRLAFVLPFHGGRVRLRIWGFGLVEG